MQTFPERGIKEIIQTLQCSQDEAIKVIRETNKPILDQIVTGKASTTDTVAGLIMFAATDLSTYVISPTLERILAKTKFDMDNNFILNRGYKFLEKNLGQSKDLQGMLSIQTSDTYGVFVLRRNEMLVINSPDVNSEAEYMNLNTSPGSSFKDYAAQGKVTVEHFDILLRSFAYIVCSGQPDLRDELNVSKINSPKKIRKVKTYDKPILPRVNVGLGYEKTPLYQTGEWLRRGHFRNQPYGPRGNPTHYELIWIDETTVHRRLET